ncbi:protein DOWNY MILDEW RESISTANCE 6-like [Sesamum indicum]|uniref:Protein DOWNY MILDEW RESISTANCE 6-like n=1 Tax=Sesamum indicum TaxID=4182 RepID=A0A6I9UM43_SESIN|nr:protein DOWNY MILDEW RESISTANCE 6-like [Sesamum indicum]
MLTATCNSPPANNVNNTPKFLIDRSSFTFPLKKPSSMAFSQKKETQNGSVNDYKKGIKHLLDTAPEINKLPSEFVLPLDTSPLSATRTDIPVIDLSGLCGPPDTRISTVKAISDACALWGFFRIVNHGVEKSLMEEMVKVAEEFFDLNLAEKMKYASDDVMSPMRYGTSLNTSKSHALHWRDYFRHYGYPFEDNLDLWPVNPPTYRNVAREYLEQVWKLAMKLASAISEGLGLDDGYVEKFVGEGFQILAANYYPPCPEPDKTLGLAAHSDHGALTILMENGVEGLQVNHNGTWIALQHVPGTFIVNLGDCLEILSNGKYKSAEHRATVNAQKTRISIAVGHGPALSSTIAPATPLLDQTQGAHFQPIVYKDYIKLQQSSTIRGKSALLAVRKNE